MKDTPEQAAARQAAREEKSREEIARALERRLSAVAREIGPRYSRCTLENYECSDREQTAVVAKLMDFSNAMASGSALGSIVLFGPVGTGKDHLLAALMLRAAAAGHNVSWTNGMDLFAFYRDSIDGQRSEQNVVDKYTHPDVLCISDPIPPWGELSQGQVSFLFRVIDRRYRDLKPTWCSMNASDGKDASKRMSDQLTDRLKDGALCLHCNWPSYRRQKSTK